MRYRLALGIGASLAATALLGCRSVRPPVEFEYEIRPPNAATSAAPEPVPAGEAVRETSEGPVSFPQIEIDPRASEGYESIPENLRNLYEGEPRELAAFDVVDQTLRHDRAIRIQNYVLQIDEARIPIAKGIYDLALRGRFQRQKDSSQSASGIQASGTRRNSAAFESLSQLLPTGATLALQHDYNRVNQNFQFAAINPIVAHSLTLSLTQPLLRGFGPSATNVDIHIAQEDFEISSADFEARIMDSVRNSLDLYWDLVLQVERYDVQLISYLAALDLLRVNSAKERAGVMAPTDVLQAQARAEQRRQSVILARQAVRDAEDRLKLAMFFQDEAPDWALELRPTAELAWREWELDFDVALGEAYERRPELRAAASLIDRRELEILKAKDQLKPEFNVFGSIEVMGLGDGSRVALDNLEATEFNVITGGIEYSHAIQNRRGRYLHRQSVSSRDLAKEDFLRVRDQVTFEIRQAIRRLKTAREVIDVAAARVASERANLEAEKKRLEFGVSTSFQVLEFQEFLASAQDSYVQAVVEYHKAGIAVERARGTLLETSGVEIALPETRPDSWRDVMPVGRH